MSGIVERAEELAELERALAAAREHGTGSLVLLAGEAGVGKTALLQSFCDAQAAPVRVLWGACEPLLTPRPLGAFLDVAEEVGGELEQLVAAEARPHQIASELMRELGRRRPTVLVLEDMQWADEATLDILTLVGRRARSVPALVAVSFRDDRLEAAPQLRVVLGELAGRVLRRRIEPLSAEAVRELAGSRALDALELHRLTGGNAFFVTEVLEAGGETLPETVRDAVHARTAALAPQARELLDAVAIVPGHADRQLVEELAGDRAGRLDECVAAGMLVASAGHVGFRHELARLAIEEGLAPARRSALHAAALAALEARAGEKDYAALAHHAHAAGDAAALLRWAPVAAERAARAGAHREAAAHYRRALEFAGELALEQRAELLERHVDECWLTDQFDSAIEAQEQALACRRELGDVLAEGDALRTLSRLLFFVGRVDEGEARALQAVELLERAAPGHELAMAYANLSQRRMVVWELQSAVEWGQRAIEVAERIGDAEALVYALTNIGAAELQAGSEEGHAQLVRALELARTHDLADYAGRAFPSIVLSALRRRKLDLAEEYLEPGLEYCRERGLDTWRLFLLAWRARIELYRGLWEQASESAELVLRDHRSAAVPRASALITLALVRARRGDPGVAELLDEDRGAALATHEPERVGELACARAEAAWLAGESASIERDSAPALELALARGARWLAGALAYWRRCAGVKEELPRDAVAEPYALSLAGDPRGAADLWREMGCPYEAALALAECDDEHALRSAHAELQELGAAPAAAIVARRLRERGVRGVPRGPRARTRENPAGLTARELQVLELVAHGLRNADIAARLVVSERTAEHHVSAILRKLDVRTRGEAAAAAARLGLTDVGAGVRGEATPRASD